MTKFYSSLLAVIIASFSSMATYATQLNFMLSDEIKNNQDSISIQLTEDASTCTLENGTYNCQTGGLSLNGISQEKLNSVITLLNNALADDNEHNEYKYITVGYIKGNSNIFPASCVNIKLNPVTNIYLTESGCRI